MLGFNMVKKFEEFLKNFSEISISYLFSTFNKIFFKNSIISIISQQYMRKKYFINIFFTPVATRQSES